MATVPHIICTVTNDLNYDQRMIRICNTLVANGYQVTLVGRKMAGSSPLQPRPFVQKRLTCFFEKGALMYAEFNIRLFLWLLLQRAQCLCAIDLDTILPVLFVSRLRGRKRVYDAHELFCEMKEVVTRPSRYRIWKGIERYAVPQFRHGYTVCSPIAEEFKKMYGVEYGVIRNVPFRRQQQATATAQATNLPLPEGPFFLYQGAVNEGRSFETLIPAMKEVALPLVIFGDGNFYRQAQQLIVQHQLQHKVILAGTLPPDELHRVTPLAYAGITLFEHNGKSNYLSLANRFFDYIQAGIPQLCVNYPAYQEIHNRYNIMLPITYLSPESIAQHLNLLASDRVLYEQLRENCRKAAVHLNWEQESQQLINFYRNLLG